MCHLKMFITYLLVVYSFAQIPGKKSCKNNDCMLVEECPGAAKMSELEKTNKTMRNKLKSALCNQQMVNGRKISLVCCSDFELHKANKELLPVMEIKKIVENSFQPTDDNEDFTKHKNFVQLPQNCGGTQYDGYVLDATVASANELRWMAAIRGKSRHGKKISFICGGTIITARYVLTAAHCVVNKKLSNVRICVMDKNKCDGNVHCRHFECNKNYRQKLRIENAIYHDDYRTEPIIENDIAIIKVKKNIDFSSGNFEPICLPIFNYKLNLSGINAIIAGWGNASTGTPSKYLREITIPILPKNKCPRDARSSSVLCAGEFGKDSCKGDSGGPLMAPGLYNNTMRMIQYGIVSNGAHYCGFGEPGVYTDVTKYLGWILDILEG